MNLSMKILCFVACLAAGFVFPLAFLGAIVLAFGIWTDTSKDHNAPRRPLQRGGAGSRLYKEKEHFRHASESPAEEAFFDAMVAAFNLEVQEGKLLGDDGISLDMQVEVLRYRLDFLVDKRLIVEIDGAAWHSSAEAVEKDKQRDASLSSVGYHILWIPAKVALYSPDLAIKRVRKARELVRQEDAMKAEARAEAARTGGAPVGTPTQQIVEAIRPRRIISSVSSAFDTFGKAVSEIDAYAQKSLDEQKEQKKVYSDINHLARRHEFSRLVRLEELKKFYPESKESSVDFNTFFELIVGEEKREEMEIETLKERMPGYRRPVQSRHTGSGDLQIYKKENTAGGEAKPVDQEGWIVWLGKKHRFYTCFEEATRKLSEPGEIEQRVSPPPLVGDLSKWRAKVREMKDEHFPYPASLKDLEHNR